MEVLINSWYIRDKGVLCSTYIHVHISIYVYTIHISPEMGRTRNEVSERQRWKNGEFSFSQRDENGGDKRE